MADYPIVKVSWFDACGDSAWTDLETLIGTDPTAAVTVGFLIYEDDKKIIIASSKHIDNGIGSWDIIPQGMVDEVIYMTEERRKID